jgi:hypothetical protein
MPDPQPRRLTHGWQRSSGRPQHRQIHVRLYHSTRALTRDILGRVVMISFDELEPESPSKRGADEALASARDTITTEMLGSSSVLAMAESHEAARSRYERRDDRSRVIRVKSLTQHSGTL